MRVLLSKKLQLDDNETNDTLKAVLETFISIELARLLEIVF